MGITNSKLVSRLGSNGITLVEVIGVVVILGILTAIAVPSVMGIIDGAKEDVCKSNRDELERTFEAELSLKNIEGTDALFGQWLLEYGGEICPVGGDMNYVNGVVECSVHGGNGEDVEEEDGGVPFL